MYSESGSMRAPCHTLEAARSSMMWGKAGEFQAVGKLSQNPNLERTIISADPEGEVFHGATGQLEYIIPALPSSRNGPRKFRHLAGIEFRYSADEKGSRCPGYNADGQHIPKLLRYQESGCSGLGLSFLLQQ